MTTRRKALWSACTLLIAAVALWMCRPHDAATPDSQTTPDETTTLPPTKLDEGVRVGVAASFGNLTVFAIHSERADDIGPFTTLAAALERHEAEVREIGVEAPARPVPERGPNPQPSSADLQQQNLDRAEVNRVVIANKGKLPIIVLAGTVVAGGKQDRQIAQDFVVKPGETTDVEAFCVEQHRWQQERDGRATGGHFSVLPTLAASDVRTAGQLNKDQGKVWEEVAKVNAANDKHKPSGSLAATLEDPELIERREALTAKMLAHFDAQKPASTVVGMAYAIDGKVRTVRWFMNAQLFSLHRAALANTAAMEAITAAAGGDVAARAEAQRAAARMTPDDVVSFIAELEQEPEKAAELVNDRDNQRETKRGKKSYGWTLSTATAQPAAAPGQPPPKKKKPLTKGYTAF